MLPYLVALVEAALADFLSDLFEAPQITPEIFRLAPGTQYEDASLDVLGDVPKNLVPTVMLLIKINKEQHQAMLKAFHRLIVGVFKTVSHPTPPPGNR
ncbi:MAG: hypothetical protein AAFX99_34165 [Myxococcota bacterium]